jgi:hypothetical protein
VDVFYADPAVAAVPPVAKLIAHSARWSVLKSGSEDGHRWAVLVRRRIALRSR